MAQTLAWLLPTKVIVDGGAIYLGFLWHLHLHSELDGAAHVLAFRENLDVTLVCIDEALANYEAHPTTFHIHICRAI